MFKELQIIEVITLEPSEFGRMKEVVETKIKNKVNTCTKELGYIIEILSISPIPQTAMISRTSGGCVIKVSFTAKTLIPENGDVFESKVIHLYPEAIFAVIHSIQVIIPLSGDSWVLQDSNQGNYKGAIIKLGDYLSIRIIDQRYVKSKYQCIGEIV